jgi:hypothetical protein
MGLQRLCSKFENVITNMETLQIKQSAGTEAVKRLRKKKLLLGHPFMINSKTLPTGQFYMEYPSGIIKLAVISKSKRDYEILRELNPQESIELRAKHNLY